MAKYARKGDKVWDWTVRQFAGEWVPGGIEWDASDPVTFWDSVCYPAADGKKARLQVTALSALKNFHYMEPKAGDELWYYTVFELVNFEMHQKIDQVNNDAHQGKIDGEEYSFRIYMIECTDTRTRVIAFFRDLWAPNCKEMGIDPWDEFTRTRLNIKVPVFTPQQFLDRYFKVDYSPTSQPSSRDESFVFHHNFYLHHYETVILPRMNSQGITPPAPMTLAELKQKMTAELTTVSEKR